MTVNTYWETPIYSRQYEDDEEYHNQLTTLVNAKITDMKASGITHIADENVNFSAFPKIMDRFKLAFDTLCELYDHPINYNIKDLNIINPMNFGEFKSVHSHDVIDAFAVFYVDVGNSEGGKLRIYDPRWQNKKAFVPKKPYIEIQPTNGLLIAAPHYVWHEVTPYLGSEQRISLVCNMTFNEIIG
mgnify:CR=1 FL=1